MSDRARATETNPAPRNEADQVAAVTALLNGEKPSFEGENPDLPRTGPERAADGTFTSAAPTPAEERDGAAPQPAPEAAPPRTLKELAERLEVEPQTLYDLELVTGDGETVKLGALKDAWGDRQQAQRETAQREQGLDEREAALLADVRLITQLGADLKGKVSPQTVAALREKSQATEAMERQRMLAAMPELRDQSAFDAWRGEVVEFLGAYGFRPQEMAIGDHRMLVILRDFMRTKARLDKLLAWEPERAPPAAARPNGRTAPPSGSRQLVETARRSGKQADQVAAIAGLIGEK